jgi:hypothetical protein
MHESYPVTVLRFALSGSVLLTDKLSVVAGIVVPALFYVSGKPMPDWAVGYVASSLVIIVLATAGLRLLFAPYFVWKDQRAEIAELRRQLDSPNRIEREKLAEIMAQERKKVVDEVHRTKRFVVFENWTDEQIKNVFHGSEESVDLFLNDKTFRELWDAFHAGVVEFAAERRKIGRATRDGLPAQLARMKADGDRRRLDAAAEAVIARILYWGEPR